MEVNSYMVLIGLVRLFILIVDSARALECTLGTEPNMRLSVCRWYAEWYWKTKLVLWM